MRPYFKIVRRAGGYRAQYWSGGNLVWWTETYVHKSGQSRLASGRGAGRSGVPPLVSALCAKPS
jgi:hypothetical protein